MFDYSPADDNGRLYDYADANDPDEEWEPVEIPVKITSWWGDDHA